MIFSDTKQVSYLELDAVYNANFLYHNGILKRQEESGNLKSLFLIRINSSTANGRPVLFIKEVELNNSGR